MADLDARAAARSTGLFAWWRESPPEAHRALVAAFLGWMLDAFDVMLYALVLAALIAELGMDKATAGLLGAVTLLASAAGGILFGFVADRDGRTRALMASILLYSIFTAACGFAQTVAQLAVFRVLLGLGMGGEWASGAALVSETWPAEHRGKALGFMQSAWAVGYALAAAVVAVVLPAWGWRAVFFIGVLPAFFTFWVRRHVEEPAIWRRSQSEPGPRGRFTDIFRGPMLALTLAVTAMNACTMFAWWGFNLWIPAYLSLPRADGGVGLALGPFVAFFGTGYFSGFGAVTAEIYPTAIRATAQGFTYNIGRVASAAAPFAIGTLADTHGFQVALSLAAAAFVLAAVGWVWIPETRGRALV